MLLKELEGNFYSTGLVFIKVKLFFRPPEIMCQMDHGHHCAAIHLFNIRIARYFLSILHIHGEFIFITVALFISPFPPREIMYPRRCSATVLFFQRLNSEIQLIFCLLHGGHRKVHNSPGEPIGVNLLLTRPDATRENCITCPVRDLPPYFVRHTSGNPNSLVGRILDREI